MPQGPSNPFDTESGQGGTPKLSTIDRLSGHFCMRRLHGTVLLPHWPSSCVRALCFSRDTLGGWRTGAEGSEAGRQNPKPSVLFQNCAVRTAAARHVCSLGTRKVACQVCSLLNESIMEKKATMETIKRLKTGHRIWRAGRRKVSKEENDRCKSQAKGKQQRDWGPEKEPRSGTEQ